MKIKLSELRKVIKEETAQEQFALTAQEEAEKINAQTGASYVTDQSYWEELGISTGEELALSILHQTYSDTYKSLHGIRPRGIEFKTVEEAQQSIDDLDKEAELISANDEIWLEKEAEWEKERQKLSDLEAPGLDLDYQKLSKHSGMGRRTESIKKERNKTMKITAKQLREIIKEEKSKMLKEQFGIESLSPLAAFGEAWAGLGSMVSEQVVLLMNSWVEGRLEDELRSNDINPSAIRLAADRLSNSLYMLGGTNPDAEELAEALEDAVKILDLDSGE